MTTDLEMQGRDPPRASLSLALGSLATANVVLTVAFQIVILRSFGAGARADILVAAQAAPMVVFAIAGASLVSVWQPVFATAATDERPELVAHALGQVLGALSGLTVLLALTCTIWTPLLFPGFSHQVLHEATEIGQMLLPTLVLTGAASILVAYARADERFLIGEVIQATISAAALASLTPIIGYAGLRGVAWLIVTRSALIVLVLWFAVGRPMPRFGEHPAKQDIWKSASPILAGSSLYKLSPLVDRNLASLAGAGGMALFNLAQMGGSALSSVIDRAFGTPIAPSLARSWAAAQYDVFRTAYRRATLIILTCTVILAIALALLWPVWPAIAQALLHLPPTQSHLLYTLCFGLLGMLGAAAGASTLVTAFYAAGDTRTPMVIGVIGFLISLLVKYALFMELKLPGLAWATSIYYGINCLLMWVMLERRIGQYAAPRGRT